MKTILSSDYFLSRIVKILGEIGFVPGCLILLVLMTMSSFASAHHLPNSIKDHKSFDLTTSFEIKTRAYDSRISELTPGLDEEHPHGGSISFPTFHSNLHCHPDEGRISFYPITGTIYDAGGGIPGVVIKIKGTNIFTITDEFGQFQIDAQKGDILIISYPDYETIEVPINEQTEINLELFPAVTQLEEAVINAGYYTVKDKERTGSIYKVTAKEIENQPVNNVLDALQGRVPGLDITPTTGLAGGGYTVRIRGQNSISAGNEPLYIIDGVPYDVNSLSSVNVSGTILPSGNINPLNTLDPSSIESIEVLKDADATAIYGSRGANGVLLITTKKGRAGKTSFTVDASTTLISVSRFRKLLTTSQYLKLREAAFANDGITEYPLNAYDINGTWDQSRYTDWQKEFLGKTAQNNTLKIGVSGGNEFTHVAIGSSITKESTVFPSDYNYRRTSVFSNLSHSSKNKRFQLQFSAQYGQDKNYLPGSDLSRKAVELPPNAPALYDESGELNWENSTWSNPYADLNSTYKNDSKSLLTNANLSYELWKGISLKSAFGYQESELEENRKIPHTIYNPAFGLTSASSYLSHNEAERNTWIMEPQLDAVFDLSESNLNILLGSTLMEKNENRSTILAMGFSNNSLMNSLSAANMVMYLNEMAQQYRYFAVYARLNYNWKQRYYLNLTGRNDGSSRFGPNNRYSYFGAAGAAWVFSNEPFLNETHWLSFGKIRASHGITGNDQIGDHQYLQTYSVTDESYQGNIGLTPTRLFNATYEWEKTQKTEAALEFSFLQKRIELEVAYYRNLSKNQLVGIPLPATTGFSSINGNLDAEIENTGWEFSLHTHIIRSSEFNWQTSLQLTVPKNRLLSFEGLENSTYKQQLVIGQPLNILRLYNLTGVNSQTGIYEFEDYNGDGIISAAEDRQYNAHLNPELYGSVQQTLSYKQWSLGLNFQFVKKKGLNEYYGFYQPGLMFNQPAEVLHHWQQPGDFSNNQMISAGYNNDASLAYSQFTSSSGILSDASFLRLKSFHFSYNLPKSEDSWSHCRIFLEGQNLFTLTSFKGGDPETTNGYLPAKRRIAVGINVEF